MGVHDWKGVTDLNRHLAGDLETAIKKYEEVHEKGLPHLRWNALAGAHDSLYQHVLSSAKKRIGTTTKDDETVFNPAYIEDSVTKHSEQLEGILGEALGKWVTGAGLMDEATLATVRKGEDAVQQLANLYDTATGANREEGQGMGILLQLIRSKNSKIKVRDIFDRLRAEGYESLDRHQQVLDAKAWARTGGQFEPWEANAYFMGALDKAGLVPEDPARFIMQNPRQTYQAYQAATGDLYGQLGLKRKPTEKK